MTFMIINSLHASYFLSRYYYYNQTLNASSLHVLKDSEARLTDPYLKMLEWNCFLVTNSYVYSLFRIAIGGIMLFVWIGRVSAKVDESVRGGLTSHV